MDSWAERRQRVAGAVNLQIAEWNIANHTGKIVGGEIAIGKVLMQDNVCCGYRSLAIRELIAERSTITIRNFSLSGRKPAKLPTPRPALGYCHESRPFGQAYPK